MVERIGSRTTFSENKSLKSQSIIIVIIVHVLITVFLNYLTFDYPSSWRPEVSSVFPLFL